MAAVTCSDEATIQFIVHLDDKSNHDIILKRLDRKHVVISKSREEFVRKELLVRARVNAFNPDTD
jgi:hypothetical protein